MHIPDGFLNPATLAATGVVSAVGIGLAVKITGKSLNEKQVPLMGVTAAFIFAAQMLNFPIAGGTSGHFMGAALAAIILGPWAGLLVMSCVLIAQCLIFQDGGLLALGANIFNMGIIACFGSYAVYRLVTGLMGSYRKSRLIGGFAGAWVALVLSSAACALQLSLSGTSPVQFVFPAMVGIHALIGIVEGLVTVAVLNALMAVRGDIFSMPGKPPVEIKVGGEAK